MDNMPRMRTYMGARRRVHALALTGHARGVVFGAGGGAGIHSNPMVLFNALHFLLTFSQANSRGATSSQS